MAAATPGISRAAAVGDGAWLRSGAGAAASQGLLEAWGRIKARHQGAWEPLAYVGLGVLLGLVIIALFPAKCEPPEEASPSPNAPPPASAAPTSAAASDAQGPPPSVEQEQQAEEQQPKGAELLRAALADERRWVKRFSGGMFGLTEGQVRTAVARARADLDGADAAMDYGSFSARVDLVFYLLSFGALAYFVARDYVGGASPLNPAALGGGEL